MNVAEIDALLTVSHLSETVVLKPSGEVVANAFGCIASVKTSITSDAEYHLAKVPHLLDQVVACGGKGTTVTACEGILRIRGNCQPDYQCALRFSENQTTTVCPDTATILARLRLAGRQRKYLKRIKRLMKKVKLYEISGEEDKVRLRMQTPMKAKPGFTPIDSNMILDAEVHRSFTASFNGKHLLSSSLARGDYTITVYDDGNFGTVLECRPDAIPILTYWITSRVY